MTLCLDEILANHRWVNASKEGGWLPQFPAPGYRSCMTGSLIDSVFGDAAAKGIGGYDVEAAFVALRKHATQPGNPDSGYGRRGIEDYLKRGYVPADHVAQSAVETLDSAYGDFCIAQVARALGKDNDAALFEERARNWRNVFDSGTRFMRGKTSDGKWVEPFDPVSWGGAYVEGAEDCTGCTLCVEICPVKSKSEAKHKAINMEMQAPLREPEAKNWSFFESLPEIDRDRLSHTQVKDIQLLEPLFEFSGACAGCGETPYLKLLTQLFGDRLLIANATGCSSIYGGNLPTTPYSVNKSGRGPTWSNSLFEDNAEFGMGMRLAVDQQKGYAENLLGRLAPVLGDELVTAIVGADQSKESGINAQRERVRLVREKLAGVDSREARALLAVSDSLVRKSVWIIGGDGWAYDIGFGGLDHVLGSGQNVKVLVLDTETYSNTGGQMSKATPRGAVAKFAEGGKPNSKKDLAMEAVAYGSVYVARVAMGSSDMQVVKAFQEAEAYNGPAIIIAYSHCIAHGYELAYGMEQQKNAVLSGYWPLMRYNPALRAEGKNPFILDSKAPTMSLKQYSYHEARYTMLARSRPEVAAKLLVEAQDDVERAWRVYSGRAAMPGRGASPHIAPPEPEGNIAPLGSGRS